MHPIVVVNLRIAIPWLVIALAISGCRGLPERAVANGHDDARVALKGPPDDELERRIAEIFAQLGGLQDVAVQVRAGVVHLSGTTESLADEQRARRVATRIEGVVDVTSDVHAPEHLLATTWRALRRVGRSLLELLPQLTAAVLVFVPFVLLSLLVGRWRRPFRVFGVSPLTPSLVRFGVRIALFVCGIVLALEILGIASIIGAVVGTLGVLGLAGGIIFKDWVANYFPAVMLGMHPPFEAGDLVQIGDREGRVVKITPRATVLMTVDGEEVRVPNSTLFERTLINYSRFRERRLRFVVPVALNADLQLAEEMGRKALLHIDGVLSEPPPFMRVRTLARDFIDVEFFAWVDQDTAHFLSVESRARRAVHDTLTEAGIPRPMFELHSTNVDNAEERDAAFVQEQVERATAAASSGLSEPRERRQ